MICSRCGKDAAQVYTRRNKDEEIRLVLCPACYRALYPEQEDEFFTSFLEKPRGTKRACPDCGTTLDDYRATGLLGCAYCYTAFREELTPSIRYIHGKIGHVGKRPSAAAMENYDKTRELVVRKDTLKKQIEEALRRRDYTLAERLETELKEVNARLKGGVQS